jgi:hypothetical protein
VTHEGNISALRVQKLSPGSTFWTEEQSRRNFESASKLVVPALGLADPGRMGPREKSRRFFRQVADDRSAKISQDVCFQVGEDFVWVRRKVNSYQFKLESFCQVAAEAAV